MRNLISISGWTMRPRVSLFGLLALSLVSPVVAEAPASAEPSLELLEFLAGWEMEDGTSIDPVQLLESELPLEPQDATESDDDE